VPERIAVETLKTDASAPAIIPQWGDPANADRIASVHLVASIDDGIATDRPAYARADQHVTIHAVIESGKHVFADVSEAKLGGHAVHPEPLAAAPRFSIAWNRVEPAAASYSNTEGGEFHFTEIEYRTTAIADAHETVLAADVRPTLTTDHGHGVGTMRFQAVVTQGETTIASPGPEAKRGRGSGGLTDAVLRVTIRRDDTYLGFLTEMYGQPYIWASAGLSDATHESERLEGSDCADFVVYGARRAGKKLAYTWTGGLPEITRLLASGTRGDDGIYRDAAGKPLPFTKPGDLILFPRHVGALVEDRGTIGVLDDQDLMMHTLFDSPKEQAIADSGYADKPVELRRFK
jgi:cell wall-associated NlpC family hydrolase